MSGTDYLTGLKGKQVPTEAGSWIFRFLEAVGRSVSVWACSGTRGQSRSVAGQVLVPSERTGRNCLSSTKDCSRASVTTWCLSLPLLRNLFSLRWCQNPWRIHRFPLCVACPLSPLTLVSLPPSLSWHPAPRGVWCLRATPWVGTRAGKTDIKWVTERFRGWRRLHAVTCLAASAAPSAADSAGGE